MQIYETFISYRRSESLAEVQNIYQALISKGYSTFCDIHSLNSGRFDNNLKEIIDNCTNYILVLSEHSLDRCVEDDDWLRFEISEALLTDKNIICVFIGDYKFPSKLPEQIDDIRYYNGIRYDFAYFQGFIDCLISRFLASASEVGISDDSRDFLIDGNILIKYLGNAPIVNIPNNVVEISNNAFKDKTRITELNFPERLVQIGDSAFERCINITHLTFPNTLQIVGVNAFARCYNLSYVAFNDDLQVVDDNAFGFCAKLKSIRFGRGVRVVASSAFNNCNKLAHIYVSNDNEYYSTFDGILYNKDQTELIRCPEGYDSDLVNVLPTVEILASWCFSRCINVVDIVLPRHLKKVHKYAFNECSNIFSLTLGDEIDEFDVSALNGWNDGQRVVVSRKFNPLIRYKIEQKIYEQPNLLREERQVTAKYIVVKTTFESHEEAARMARMLLDNRLIASAQLGQLNVFYTWNEEFCNENEIELSCITRGVLYNKVAEYIKQHHSYECCQLVCLPIIETTNEFGEWINAQTS